MEQNKTMKKLLGKLTKLANRVHSKNGAFVIPYYDDPETGGRNILMLERVKEFGVYPAGTLDLPGGGTKKKKEHPAIAAARELFEETGINSCLQNPFGCLEPIAVFTSNDGRETHYFAYQLTPDDIKNIKISDEHRAYFLLPVDELHILHHETEPKKVLTLHGDMIFSYLYGPGYRGRDGDFYLDRYAESEMDLPVFQYLPKQPSLLEAR